MHIETKRWFRLDPGTLCRGVVQRSGLLLDLTDDEATTNRRLSSTQDICRCTNVHPCCTCRVHFLRHHEFYGNATLAGHPLRCTLHTCQHGSTVV